MLRRTVGAGRPAVGRRRLGHADGADVPHEAFAPLPVAGASSTTRCWSSSTSSPSSSRRSASYAAKAPGYEADDFLGAAVASRRGEAAPSSSPRPTGTCSSSRASGRRCCSRGEGVSDIERDRAGRRCASGTASSRRRCPTSSRCAATRRTSCPARAASGRRRRRHCSSSTARWRRRSRRAASAPIAEDLRLYRRIATVDASAPLPSLNDRSPTWAEASALVRSWGLNQLAERLAARA